MDLLSATRSEGVVLIVRAISFRDFQPIWSQITNVTDRRTDGRTDGRHAIPRPRICTKVHCAVKTKDHQPRTSRTVQHAVLMLPDAVYRLHWRIPTRLETHIVTFRLKLQACVLSSILPIYFLISWLGEIRPNIFTKFRSSCNWPLSALVHTIC